MPRVKSFGRATAVLWAAVALFGCDRKPATEPVAPPAPAGKSAWVEPTPEPKTEPDRPAKVFALLVGDGTAAAVATGVTLDIGRNPAAVRALLANGLGADRLVVVSLAGAGAAPDALERAIRDLPVTDKDALVCYVSGVGGHASDANPDGFAFALHGAGAPAPLPRAALRKWLTDRKARLTVLLSDTAAGAPGAPKWPLPLSGTAKLDDVVADIRPDEMLPLADRSAVMPGFEALFLGASGVVDWAAAEERASGWGPPRETGFFTRALVRTIYDAQHDPKASWGAVYRRTRKDTESAFAAWRASELDRLKARPGPEVAQALRALAGQERQWPRAYYLPGTALKMITRDTPESNGVAVVELPLDSPCRAAGIRAGEVVVAVQGKPTPTVADWTAIAGGAISAGAKQLTFRVRQSDGKERDATVELAP